MHKYGFLLIALCLILQACSGIKRPSSDPAKMSSNALCYRAELKRSNPAERAAFDQEIDRRNLECDAILGDDPLMGERRF